MAKDEIQLPTHEDYSSYYRGCICYINDKLVALGRLQSGDDVDYHVITTKWTPYEQCEPDSETKKATLKHIFENKKPFIPKYGFIPTDQKSVAYISLMPHRQYFRDFNHMRTATFLPNSAELGIRRLSEYDSRALPIILRDRGYLSLWEGISKIYSGKLLGVALSDEYAMVATYYNKRAILFRKTRAIGTVDEAGVFRPTLEVFTNLPNLPTGLKVATK